MKRGTTVAAMKLYDFKGAPNPKRVRMYLAEKSIDIARVDVNLVAGETRSPEFLAKNPLGALPVLELDDGTHVTESLAIIEYLEELHPEPPMLGRTPLERLRTRELERIAELGVLLRVAVILWNTHPFFARSIPQAEAPALHAKKQLERTLFVLDQRIGESPFVAGAAPSIADCTLYSALWFAHSMGLDLELARWPNLARWHTEFRQRPSAKA